MIASKSGYVLAIGALMLGGTASAAVVATFESPTFTATQTVNGIDGWSTLSPLYVKVTPGATANRGYMAAPPFSAVLEGSQSMSVENAQVMKRITDTDLTTGSTLKYLTQIHGDTGLAAVYLTHNTSSGSTPVGIQMPAGGNFTLFGGSNVPDQTVPVVNQNTYLVEMIPNFDAGNITAYVTNITASGPRTRLGTATFATGFTAAEVLANGGLSIGSSIEGPNNRPTAVAGDYSGVAYFDAFEITPVPEPATLSLLAFGGMAICGRRRRN